MNEPPAENEHETSTDPETETDTGLRAELYVREDTHRGLGVQQVVDRSNRLEANGVLGESMVAGTWHRCHTRAEDWRSAAMDTYEEFRVWAETNGFSLEPGFQQRVRSFVGMDDVEDVVVFPIVALALYDDRDLRAVFPCTDEERTHTVESALAAFERGDEDWLTQFDPVTVEHAEPRLDAGGTTAD